MNPHLSFSNTFGRPRPVQWSRVLLAALITSSPLHAVELAKWSFSTLTGSSPTAPVTAVDASVQSASAITRGSGIGAASASAAFSSNNWTTGTAIDANDYYQFTVTPGAGNVLNIDTLHFAESRAATGPRQFEVRSSQDGYAATIPGTGFLIPDVTTSRTHSLSLGSAFDSIVASVTFRIYAFEAVSGTGTWRLLNHGATFQGLVLEGSSTASAGTLTVQIAPSAFSESAANPAAIGTVTRTGSTANEVTVTLVSSDVTEATVPPTVVIPAGQPAANFSVTAQDDSIPDGNIVVTVSATAPGYTGGGGQATVQDDGDVLPVVISQYYEGAASDKYIELHNPKLTAITLTGYHLTAWLNAAAESWKTTGNTPDAQLDLSGITIQPGAYILIKTPGAAAPSYAVPSADLTNSGVVGAFSGNDSIVLYSSNVFNPAGIVDAVSFTNVGNEGADKSFYRLSNALGHDFTAGSNVTTFPAVWAIKTPAEVAAATSDQTWYLKSSTLPPALTLTITPSTFAESTGDGPGPGDGAATAVVARSGATTGPLDVTVTSNNPAKAFAAVMTVTIPDGSPSVEFEIYAADNSYLDGNKQVTITTQATGFLPDSEVVTVTDDAGDTPIFTNLVINEVDSDTPGGDLLEFVELLNKSGQPQALDGLVLVFYNGDNSSSYRTQDLTGYTIPANGYFVIGNPGVASAGATFSNGSLQNGPDGVAIHAAGVFEIPNNTLATATLASLVDAVVYDTSDADATALINALTPGEPQVDENAHAKVESHSIARAPDGGAAFDASVYVTQTPSPGASNAFAFWAATNSGEQTADQDFDGDGIDNGVEYFMGTPGNAFTVNPGIVSNTITYPRAAGTTIRSFRVEVSSNLSTWEDAALNYAANLSISANQVTFAMPTAPSPFFVRLNVAP